jgi:hypothetical protein
LYFERSDFDTSTFARSGSICAIDWISLSEGIEQLVLWHTFRAQQTTKLYKYRQLVLCKIQDDEYAQPDPKMMNAPSPIEPFGCGVQSNLLLEFVCTTLPVSLTSKRIFLSRQLSQLDIVVVLI